MSDKTQRGALLKLPEFRTYPAQFEVRADSQNDSVVVEGYASVTEQPYTMYDMFGDYSEVIRQGAFGKTLAEGPDVAFLANHDGLTMARTIGGTLELSEDSTGLLSRATLNTKRSDVRDLVLAIEDGVIDQMSFAFSVVRQQWSPDYDERAITEVNINRGDVSAVNYGANPNTNIGTRSFQGMREAEFERLARRLEAGEELSVRELQALTRIVRSLPAARTEPVAADNIREAADELAGYHDTLALRLLLDGE